MGYSHYRYQSTLAFDRKRFHWELICLICKQVNIKEWMTPFTFLTFNLIEFKMGICLLWKWKIIL